MPQRPEELVELLPEAERFLDPRGRRRRAGERRGLVLVHDLAGEFDAAHAGALAGAHLLASLPHEAIARFDADSLVDYRAHRPRMTFAGDRYESFAAPEILLYALEDDAGEPFLLLHGAEPDFAWERFVAAVARAGGAAGRDPRRRAAGHPDAGAAHPAGDRDRARDAPAADRAAIPCTGARCASPAASPPCWSCGWARPASTRSASPRTCRTTSRRPPTRPPR